MMEASVTMFIVDYNEFQAGDDYSQRAEGNWCRYRNVLTFLNRSNYSPNQIAYISRLPPPFFSKGDIKVHMYDHTVYNIDFIYHIAFTFTCNHHSVCNKK